MKTRELILEATERLILLRGLARTTTKEIAREAGCAEGTLYKHFESKEDLFLTIIQQHLPDFIETLAEAETDQSIQERLEVIAHAVMKYYRQIIPLAASFFADTELLARFREIVLKGQGGPQRIYERVAALIQEEQKTGRVKPELDPVSISALLLGACFQYVFYQQFLNTNPLAKSEEEFVRDFIRTLLAGIA